MAGTLTRPARPLGRERAPVSEPRLMALLRLLALEAEDMSSLYLSARNLDIRHAQSKVTVATYFLIVGRETPARESSGLALTHSWLISKCNQRK